MKTSSSWGEPPSRFYRFLRNALQAEAPSAAYDLAVLGCADGKFVLPAARQQMRVYAIDLDEIALGGGIKPGVGGEVYVPGLRKRLAMEGLSDHVDVVHGDFTTCKPILSRCVWVSGAVQYSFNMPKDADQILSAIKGYVAVGGLLYIDYMLPFEAKYKGRPNCPNADWWREWVSVQEFWKVLHHIVLRPTPDKAHVEFPVDHYHQWGHLLMNRLA
jgi:hypothetical protein